jgi:REP element-mobilizing transposase RayT
MPYIPRDESPGYHHVVTRGNNKRVIYKTEHDRELFCGTVDLVARKYGWTVLAYCLMRNHYHLVIRVGDQGLAAGMCRLNTAYAIRFNVEHGRINHLFGKRYWNRRLQTDDELFNAIRYVIRNPVMDGGQKPLESYRWTSYAATIGLAFSNIKLARDELLGFYGRTPEIAVAEFRASCSLPLPRGYDRWQPP